MRLPNEEKGEWTGKRDGFPPQCLRKCAGYSADALHRLFHLILT